MEDDRGLTVGELKARLNYDPATGCLKWKSSKGSRDHVGSIAGNISTNGYRVIHIDGLDRLAHRIAWAIYHGNFPEGSIDHVNGDRADNAIINLRLATRSEQAFNRPVRFDSVSQVKGCRWDETQGNYLVRIGYKKRRVTVGRFKSIEIAMAAYDAAAILLHGQFAKINGSQDAKAMCDDDRVMRAVKRLRA